MGKVVVGWLDPGQVDGVFAESVIGLIVTGTLNGLVEGWIRLETGPVLDRARNDLTDRFLTTDAEWLLTVDSDMMFAPDLLERLLAIADPAERPIVGPLCYSTNHDGVFPVAYRMVGGRFAFIANPPEDTLLKVDGVGAACLLMHRSALEKIRDDKVLPGQWYDHLFLGDKPVGEDLAFCVRARSSGIPIFVHTGIPIRHIKGRMAVDRDSFVHWRRGHRFVVTGTGRCGTGYVAELFKAMQVSCGHETVYGPEGPREWGTGRGDSSWMAAPFLRDLAGQGIKIIHLHRDPLAVVNSLVGIGFFDPAIDHGPYREFARQWCPQAFQTADPVEAATTFVIWWDSLIRPYADMSVKVEGLDPIILHQMLHLVGAEPSLAYVQQHFGEVPHDVNTRRRATLTWDDMPEALADHAEELGYGTAT